MAEKSFIDATDLAVAVHLIMTEGGLGETYNAGTEAAVSIRHIVEVTATAAGFDFENFVTIAPGRATEDTRYSLEGTKIHDELDWRPQISLDTSVAAMVEWAKANLDALKLQTQRFSLRS
ncbi:unannotated protein [freshwater metagenome]|uniref:Unannotated protein n=1 Tax=freshwater metagenome TaxID=449393 RepID=A0A6J7LNS1_9ZZZZ